MLLNYLPPILPIFLAIWLALFLAARFQTNRLKRETAALVLSSIKTALHNNHRLTVEEYYDLIYPTWEELVRTRALFILHGLELWPIPATPSLTKKRLNFTPAWVGAYLKMNGHILPVTSPELKKEISGILKLIPQNQEADSIHKPAP